MVKMKKNKRAAIFTIAAIVMSTLLLSTYFSLLDTPINSRNEITKLRIKQSNSYIEQAEFFSKEILKKITETTLNGMINHMNSTKSFFKDEQKFTDTFTNCIHGENAETYCGPSLNEALNEFKNYGINYIGFDTFNITIKNKEIKLYQEDPWNIKIDVNLTINASDGYASWSINPMTITTSIPIIGMKDPTYFVPNNNSISPIIVTKYGNESRKIFTRNTSEWRVSTGFNDYMPEGMYFPTTTGVSYLDRLKNMKRTSSCCGIASFLPNDVVHESQQFSNEYKEYYGNLDYLFFKQYTTKIPWTLEKYDFWNQQDTINHQLPEVRALHNISNVTGENLNGTIVPKELWIDVNMTDPSTQYRNYTVPTGTPKCGDEICQEYIETCDSCSLDCPPC